MPDPAIVARIAIVGIIAAAVLGMVASRLALSDELPILPDPVLTPGAGASTDAAEVCGIVDGLTYSQRHRKTSAALKAEVYRRYGITKAGRDFELDHRLELSLGGADVIENLWPESGFTHPSFRDKDRLEAEVWRMVCKRHTMSLQDGQAIFLAPDWREGYRQIFGADP